MRGNKGAADLSVDWFIALIFTVMVIVALFAIVASYKTRVVDTRDLDPYLYVAKMYHSPEILYESANGIIDYSFIDLDKFTSDNLALNNQYLDEFVGVAITLRDGSGKIYTNSSLPKGENPIYNNYDLYRELRPFALQGVKMAGGATLTTISYPVRFVIKNKLVFGYITYEIVTPHSRGDTEVPNE